MEYDMKLQLQQPPWRQKEVDPSNFLPLWHKAPKREEKEEKSTNSLIIIIIILLDVLPIDIITSMSSTTNITIVIGVNPHSSLVESSRSETGRACGVFGVVALNLCNRRVTPHVQVLIVVLLLLLILLLLILCICVGEAREVIKPRR
jgi:hypothetical protein